MVEVKDSIATVDAMGCQKDIVRQIVHHQADYVMTLKENQPTLLADVASIFTQGEAGQFKHMLNRQKIGKVPDQGHIETRGYSLVFCKDLLIFELRWPGLGSIGSLAVTRTVNHEVTRSTRYF